MASAPIDRKSGFDIFAVVLCALAGLGFVCALTLFLQGGFLTALDAEKNFKVLDTPQDEALAAQLAEQRARLNEGPRWIDREAGIVGLPIEDAKAALVAGMREESR